MPVFAAATLARSYGEVIHPGLRAGIQTRIASTFGLPRRSYGMACRRVGPASRPPSPLRGRRREIAAARTLNLDGWPDGESSARCGRKVGVSMHRRVPRARRRSYTRIASTRWSGCTSRTPTAARGCAGRGLPCSPFRDACVTMRGCGGPGLASERRPSAPAGTRQRGETFQRFDGCLVHRSLDAVRSHGTRSFWTG